MAVEFESRLDRRQAAAFLTARGYRTAPATLAKLPCIGGGPTFESFGRKPLYREAELLAWARGKTTGAQAVNKRSGRRALHRRAARPVARVQVCFQPGMPELALAIRRPTPYPAQRESAGPSHASR